jgi:hypothetical protein
MLAVLASINSIFPTIFLCVVHRLDKIWFMVRVMVFKASYNNISGISWRTALLMEETGVSGVPAENHRLAASH